MTHASAWSVALLGMAGTLVEVEAAIGPGLPRTILVGLPDSALYEARDRCKAAFAGAGLAWPNQLLTINLTPANLPKSGSHYDLAIVSAVLAAAGTVPRAIAASSVLVGELGLDGRVRPVRGLLPTLLAARDAGISTVVVPAAQVTEANLVSGLTVWGVSCLDDLVEVLHGRPVLGAPDVGRLALAPRSHNRHMDLSDVRGQPEACWAVEVAAAGGHHIFLHGAPGVGKSMLAQRLPGLLPDLGDAEALEVSALHSLAGRPLDGLIRRPPFASPHHNASMAAIVGGGARVARPGAISLAHRGVLFLDEVPEFNRQVLEALRTPMESGEVTIARSAGDAHYPARFQLVLAANPCPCGLSGVAGATCTCTPMDARRYSQRLSGPVMDRIDIHHRLLPSIRALADSTRGESSRVVADRVREARDRQRRRLADTPWTTNAEIPGPQLRQMGPLDIGLVDEAVLAGRLSARGVDKVLRVAWTLADLAGRDRPQRGELAAALGLREDSWGCAA